ncbi:MAG: class I SAM-dependent methyltransferase [Thiohalocapsa sp.]|jgi:ubiquinone/menaquinone biosynthesis C-methylase UbiE|uniref:class I SAM-dependent methyltransferase n=1 Tax=Thiohalocapsa sp. TaxID=2497641 RepID=UPI0025F79D6A|nr:class I SAM-dependent methyltransferase [Thiohalocapsa sp.]MCG6941640.1 class I SAM-dependent methyltransferase [Thiohalocapsa sp.]
MTTTKQKPDWAGEDWQSRLVNLLINTKPIYAVMKRQARRVMIKTAQKKGIPWSAQVQALDTPGIRALADRLTNSTVRYPDYYQVPFHAYAQGNLCWLAAFEAAPATYAVAARLWPQESLTPDASHARMRGGFLRILDEYGPGEVRDILDIGCSVGISTLTIHRHFAEGQHQPVRTTGLDLSPYMLAVAKTRDTKDEITAWLHAPAEDTGLPPESFDLITLQFVAHELPRDAALDIFHEAHRMLRPGGTIALVDSDPKSPALQSLPPVLFTLMKSTEPWSDDYYTFDVARGLEQAGFQAPVTAPSDPRHRAIVARKGS